MRRGSHTIFTVQLTLAYSNLASTRFPVDSVLKKFPLWRADSCGRKSNPEIRVDESTVQYFYEISTTWLFRFNLQNITKKEEREKD